MPDRDSLDRAVQQMMFLVTDKDYTVVQLSMQLLANLAELNTRQMSDSDVQGDSNLLRSVPAASSYTLPLQTQIFSKD